MVLNMFHCEVSLAHHLWVVSMLAIRSMLGTLPTVSIPNLGYFSVLFDPVPGQEHTYRIDTAGEYVDRILQDMEEARAPLPVSATRASRVALAEPLVDGYAEGCQMWKLQAGPPPNPMGMTGMQPPGNCSLRRPERWPGKRQALDIASFRAPPLYRRPDPIWTAQQEWDDAEIDAALEEARAAIEHPGSLTKPPEPHTSAWTTKRPLSASRLYSETGGGFGFVVSLFRCFVCHQQFEFVRRLNIRLPFMGEEE
ncbi:hypothetical protein PAAG_00400 [Paracoccidioides lutzii Pb01]|uniref:Uncharacterized protein n=1 Tax=Paracoccidioides lutzii (strain ATCC MYA-826 / Pb01) TaxID=502779 RepID=C1GPF5_PARBA|nr:hypothetical protein PAAG_00400 [Paracoccidioides lutzii Pb01]EEH36077.2 hypothetical protein PAAG_00400 [Paracoccidioides lutzii Pb01]